MIPDPWGAARIATGGLLCGPVMEKIDIFFFFDKIVYIIFFGGLSYVWSLCNWFVCWRI